MFVSEDKNYYSIADREIFLHALQQSAPLPGPEIGIDRLFPDNDGVFNYRLPYLGQRTQTIGVGRLFPDNDGAFDFRLTYLGPEKADY